MKITCFGKYGPYPKAGCACSSYLLTCKGKNIIVDLGCGALPRVFTKMRAEDIDAVVLSHLHADHMGDVLTLRYALDAAKKLGKRETPLPVYMPAEPVEEAGLIAACKMIEVRPLSDGARFDICGIDIRFALMPHAVPSYAMAFCAENKKFVYSGDTKYNDVLASFAKDADLFLIEAVFLKENLTQAALHVSAEQAGKIARDAKAKRLLLTHIFPECDEKDILDEALSQYPAACIIEEFKTYEV